MDSNKFYTRIIKEARPFEAKNVEMAPNASALWYWLTPKGQGMFITQRFDNSEGKTVVPSYFDGEKWLNGQAFNPTPLYNLGIFTECQDRKVLIVEGEKAANAAQKLLGDDYWVTTWCGGVGQVGKVSVLPLEGRRVYLWPDNDEPGKSAMQKMAQRLHKEAKAAKVHIVNIPADFPEKWDLADEVPEGWTVEKLRQLIVDAPEVSEISEIDEAFNKAVAEEHSGLFPEVKPYSKPVDGAELVAEIKVIINRYMVLPQYTDEAIAYWVLFTYGVNYFNFSPRLVIFSPEMRCGKSTLLSILQSLCYKSLKFSSITAAALFRTIEAYQPTILIDEADTFLRSDEGLRGIINDGHRRHGQVIRTTGDKYLPVPFKVFSACAIAGIGRLSPTIMDRAIIIGLKRKLETEKKERLRPMFLENEVKELQSKCMRFMQDNEAVLSDPATPLEIPQELNDRAADNWEPLLLIADRISVEAGEQLRKIAIAISNRSKEYDSASLTTLLLSDIRQIFAEQNKEWISSLELCEYLCSREGAPWAEYKGKGLTVNNLAYLLRDFNIHTTQKMTANGNKKVYLRENFQDAFGRYLQADTQNYKSNQDTDQNDLYSDL